MSIIINNNLSSLNSQRNLANTTSRLGHILTELSTGMRINKASDDSAGLAVASALKVDSRVYTQGVRNLNDAISVTNVAESAIGQLGTIAIRIKELAEQSANGTLGLTQRNALNAEASSLANEYNRIISTTSFNSTSLIDGSLSDLAVQGGYGDNGTLHLGIGQKLLRAVGDGSFSPTSTIGLSNLVSLRNADLNADGNLDLISQDQTGNTVIFLLGNGDGTFKTAVSLATSGSVSICTGDLNNDGRADIASADFIGHSTTVFLGNGDGTFQAGISYAIPTIPQTIQSADVNHDGNVDLITADFGSNVTSVLIGNGNGSFVAPKSYATGSGPATEVVSDINGDGNLDLLTVESLGNSVSVFFGLGDGTFKSRVSLNTGNGSRWLSVVDFNADGRQDVITSDQTDSTVSIFLGNGDGTFLQRRTYSTPGGGRGMVVGDFTGDGRPDVAICSFTTNTVGILISNGDGTLRAATSLAAGPGAQAITAGDFNNDDRLDFVIGNRTNSTASIFLGNGGQSAFLPTLNLNTRSDALAVLNSMSVALTRITSELGSLGAAQSRLSINVNNLFQTTENFDSSASQILDSDVALESANLVKNQILQQAGAAILAQSNQQPSLALVLLRGI